MFALETPSAVENEDVAAVRKALELELELELEPSPPSLASSAASSANSSTCDLRRLELPSGEDVEKEEEEEKGEGDRFDRLMNRGDYLRQLRLLALADEQERQERENEEACHGGEGALFEEKKEDTGDGVRRAEDRVTVLPSGDRVLDYGSYLAHQRYHDDLKHVDMKYMDFGRVVSSRGEDGGRLVVEQRKSLGKGGLCWDAAFVLGEHVIAREHEWNGASDGRGAPRMVELGAGTGLTGMMVAKATRSDVVVTDLPELRGLMEDNIERNFRTTSCDESDGAAADLATNDGGAMGTISSRVLRWGVESDYGGAPYDVVIGADIVTSLYDPVALARTLHALSGPDTRIYISGKSRLDRPHEEFDEEMNRLFERVEKIVEPSSRLRSPGVFVIVAGCKR